MLQGSLVRKVLLQLLGIAAYFALVVILYWRWLTDAGAVAIIVGLLFFFKTVVDSGAISIGHLSPSGPRIEYPIAGNRAIQGAQFLRCRDGGLDRSDQGNANRSGTAVPAGRGHPYHAGLHICHLRRLLFSSVLSGVEEPVRAIGHSRSLRQIWPLLMERRWVLVDRGRYAMSIHENTSRAWGFGFALRRARGLLGGAEGAASPGFAQSKVGSGFDGVRHGRRRGYCS